MKKQAKKPQSNCESCEFYDYDEYYEEYGISPREYRNATKNK